MKYFNFSFKTALSVFLLTFLFYGVPRQAVAQQKAAPGIYSAGYTEYKIKDTSRVYKPHTTQKALLHFRPVELDVWYPANIQPAAIALPFRYFVALFERRANSFQDSVSYRGLTDELLRHFTIGGESDGSGTLLTKSYLNAMKVQGHFPLIIYLCSYNGMSYENVPLFEKLASHGYMVVSITSVGRYPGNMTTQYLDVIEQVKDAEFAMQWLKDKNIDTEKTGVIGYSYGGLAAAILATRNKTIKAVLSLDGSETHYYGRDKEEDKDFNAVRQYLNFDHKQLQQPYAYLESAHKLDDGIPDSIYRLQPQTAINHPYIRLNGTAHEDFSFISGLSKADDSTYERVKQISLAFADQYVSANGTAFDTNVAEVLDRKQGLTSFAGTPPKIDNIAQLRLKGMIAASKDNAAIAYASIGIPAGDCGTVSDQDGNFVLSVNAQMRYDTIRISSLGYKPRLFTVNQLAAILKQQRTILLKEQISQLREVVIMAKKQRLKTIGNTSTSKFFNVGFPLRDLGSEVGIKVSLGKKKVRLHSFNFTISNLRLDTGTFRLNIYNLKNGLPFQNQLTQNILIGINHKPGTYHIDLTPYQIDLGGNIFISLEWIAGSTTDEHGVVFFSAGLLASSYHRKTTEASWVGFKGLGAGFNMQIEDLE